MSDGFSATVEDSVTEGFRRLGDTALRFTVPACAVTAEAIVNEARRRVRRDTGETAEGITHQPLRDGTGSFVSARNQRMPNLPLWIEAGIKQGKPRSHTQPAAPFFWPAVQLEELHHERRITEAMDEAIRVEGLGS